MIFQIFAADRFKQTEEIGDQDINGYWHQAIDTQNNDT